MKNRYRLILLPLAFAGACAYFGTLEGALARRSSSEPETISLQELLARGRNGNPYIAVTDFSIIDTFAIEKEVLSGQWTKVWVPIVPANTPDDQVPAAIQAVIFSDQVENAEQLYARLNHPKIQGLIDPDTAMPSLSASLMWKHKFPNLNLDECVVIVEGKYPANIFKLMAYGLGCIFFLAVTAAILYLAKITDTNKTVQGEVTRPT